MMVAVEPRHPEAVAGAPATTASLLPDIVFGAEAGAPPAAVRGAFQRLGTRLDGSPELQSIAVGLARGAMGGAPPTHGARLLKCEHNHVLAFEWRGMQLVHKLYGNARGGLRECVARTELADRGVPFVEAPLWAGLVDGDTGTAAAAVFAMRRGAPLKGARSFPPVARHLGAWMRRLHASHTHTGAAAAFSLVRNRMIDLGPALESPLAGPAHWRHVEELSQALLADVNDTGDCLVHNDLGTPGNVLLDTRTAAIRWIVDFEFAQIGYRAMDFLWIHMAAPRSLPEVFGAYGEPHPEGMLRVLTLWSTLVRLAEAFRHVYNPPAPCRCRQRPSRVGPSRSEVMRRFDAHARVVERLS